MVSRILSQVFRSHANNNQDLDSDYANENLTSNSPLYQKLSNPIVCVNSAIEDFKNRVIFRPYFSLFNLLFHLDFYSGSKSGSRIQQHEYFFETKTDL